MSNINSLKVGAFHQRPMTSSELHRGCAGSNRILEAGELGEDFTGAWLVTTLSAFNGRKMLVKKVGTMNLMNLTAPNIGKVIWVKNG